MKYYTTTERVEVQNYPYGYTAKTTATFGVEFKKGKGFRTFFQTINPKTGLANKPKHSTYSPVIIMLEKEDGKVGYKHLDFYGSEGITEDVKFMSENFNLFTPEQIKDIAAYLIMILKVDISANVTYCGSDLEKVLPLYTPAIENAVAIFKDGQNLFDKVIVDFPAVAALKVEGYKPFTVTTRSIIF